MAAVADQFEARICASTARIIKLATVVAAPASLGSPDSRSSVSSATRFDSSSQFRAHHATARSNADLSCGFDGTNFMSSLSRLRARAVAFKFAEASAHSSTMAGCFRRWAAPAAIAAMSRACF